MVRIKDSTSLYKENNIDDMSIGRDLAYAQILPSLPLEITNKLFIDRQYFSSYVYGLEYRSNYDKLFWQAHIRKIEKIYYENNFLKNINIVYIDPYCHMDRITNMNRNKDQYEINDILSYVNQYHRYEEVLKISNANIFKLEAFQKDEYIINFFKELIK